MQLIILGTGNASVTECYNTCFVLRDASQPAGEQCFLVDGGGGNGLLTQLKRAGIDWREIRSIFLSHRHMDHIVGILWIMRNILSGMKHGEYEGEAAIYGHAQVIHILRESAALLLSQQECDFIDDRLHLVTVEDGDAYEILGRRIEFFDIHSAKTLQFGFEMERKAADAAEGSSSGDTAADAAETSAGCHDDSAAERTLVFYGDEPARESTFSRAEHADWVLHEAFCLYEDADRFRPYEKNHSTVKDVCLNMERLHVPNLVLYHTEDTDLAHRRERYAAEGRRYYAGNLLVPEDLETIELI